MTRPRWRRSSTRALGSARSCPSDSPGAAHDWLKVAKGVMLVGLSGHTDGVDVIIEGFDVKMTCDIPPLDFRPVYPCWYPPGPLGSSHTIAGRLPRIY